MTTDGKLYSWGRNDQGQLGLGYDPNGNLPEKINLTNILSISCGCHHTIAATTDGKFYSWGKNDEGQLGLGDNNDRDLPEKIIF